MEDLVSPIELSISTYFASLDKGHQAHERLPALREIAHNLEDDDFWFLFRVVWQNTFAYFPHAKTIRELLTPDRMNAPERVGLATPDEQKVWRERIRRRRSLKLYRGGDMRNVTGFSWTTNRSIAEAHALRYGRPTPLVAVGRIDPRRLVIPLDGPQSEIVCFPEHVEVERVDELPTPATLINETSITVQAVGLPPSIYAEVIQKKSDAGELDLMDTIKALGMERDYLRSLGFERRPAMLDQLIGMLGETAVSA